jgi:hypothetical protein
MRSRSSKVVLVCTAISLALIGAVLAMSFSGELFVRRSSLNPWRLAIGACCVPYLAVLTLFLKRKEKLADAAAFGIGIVGAATPAWTIPLSFRMDAMTAGTTVEFALASVGNFVVSLVAVASAGIAWRTLRNERPKSAMAAAVMAWVAAAGAVAYAVSAAPIVGAGANTSSAISSVRSINTALVTYYSTYNALPENLAQLGGAENSRQAAALLDVAIASGEKSGYRITYVPGKGHDKDGNPMYMVFARPATPRSGAFSFYSDQTGVVRFTVEDRSANASDPPWQ